jgi:Leucine-rich repeat (LRR) protein
MWTLGLLLAVFMVFTPLNGVVLAEGEVVNIPDPALEALIRESLEKPEGDITAADMSRVTQIVGEYGDPVSDLTGLEYAINLERFMISGSSTLDDISPIKDLKNIKLFSLESSISYGIDDYIPLVDLSPIADYENLEYLTLKKLANVEKLPLFSKAKNLKSIHLEGMPKLTDLSIFDGKENLESAGLYNLGPIKALPQFSNKIEVLGLEGLSELTDISSIENYPEIFGADFADLPKIEDMSVLGTLPKLSQLYVSKCPVHDMSWLANLKELEMLSLTELPNVTDLSAIASTPIYHLRIINLPSLEDLTFLNEKSFREVGLSYTKEQEAKGQPEQLRKVTGKSADTGEDIPGLNLDVSFFSWNDLSVFTGLIPGSQLSVHSENICDLTPLKPIVETVRIYVSTTNWVKAAVDGRFTFKCVDPFGKQVELTSNDEYEIVPIEGEDGVYQVLFADSPYGNPGLVEAKFETGWVTIDEAYQEPRPENVFLGKVFIEIPFEEDDGSTDPTDPKPTDPKPTDPKPTDPKPTDPVKPPATGEATYAGWAMLMFVMVIGLTAVVLRKRTD